MLITWEPLTVPPGRLVKIYRTPRVDVHSPSPTRAKRRASLYAIYECETLKYIRGSLHTPADLHGCHVGAWLGYFREGHIAPLAPDQLGLTHLVAALCQMKCMLN